MRNNEGDIDGSLSAVSSVGFGIFGSISNTLKQK
jgi:hypothetical protein